MTLPATLRVPEFLRLEQGELNSLLHVLRDPLATQIYLLLLAHTDFKTGEFLGGYHRLMELCTPPIPERGRRRPGPSYWQVRRVVDDLIKARHVWRNAASNEAQGQLRLKIVPRDKNIAATKTINHRVSRRLQRSENLATTRLPESPMDDLPQGIPQGYQGFNSTSPTPSETASYPQSEAAKRGREELAALKAGFLSSAPKGAKATKVDADDIPY
ncbi:hypothetical protein [Polaromonas sp.]|uniref:hypothetical protein n=1 Tax=Polaromonas sp. TaxID=1869339 RepID=UPI0027314A8F|nr:hypothetical protein [Polaromonas sp.]MDP1740092.1 hypothetical protein [Polaromonas sp.]